MQKPDTASAPRPNAACAHSRPQQMATPVPPFAQHDWSAGGLHALGQGAPGCAQLQCRSRHHAAH